MQELREILCDYATSEYILEENVIKYILLKFIRLKNLGNYVVDINVRNVLSTTLADYDKEHKIINLNWQSIKQLLKIIDLQINCKSKIAMYLYKNARILQILLHEIQHVLQEKNKNLNSSIESKLIGLTNNIDLKTYTKLYPVIPAERIAEIKSFSEINKILFELYNIIPGIQELIETELLIRKLRGFEYTNGRKLEYPLMTLLKTLNKEHLLNEFMTFETNEKNGLENIPNYYSLEERMMYGFPISIDEYVLKKGIMLTLVNKNFVNKIYVK